jgi:hypothetical protein
MRAFSGVYNAAPNNALAVVHYSGHGRNEGNTGLTLHPKANNDRCGLSFAFLQGTLLNGLALDSDVLLLLDCRCAMSFYKGAVAKTTVEVIAASGANERTPVRTFTPAVCGILSSIPNSMSVSARSLHELLV